MSDNALEPAVLELLASRVCHDLISPVGAIHNGIEFMQEMGTESSAEAIDLIAHSARIASARLQVFRLAYGAGGRDPNVKPSDVKKTFGALVDADGKITQDWDAQAIAGAAMPAGFCKMLTGMLMLAAESLPKGGKIKVENSGSGVSIIAEGPDAGPRPQVREALALELTIETLDPRLVHPYVLGVLARQYGFAVEIGDGGANRAVFVLQKT